MDKYLKLIADAPDTAPEFHDASVDAAVRTERIIEATFTPASTPTYSAAEFPPCPACGQVRYWLASGGRVLCGTKQCASALRFQLIALEFHAVN
jgi:hypothetical protein